MLRIRAVVPLLAFVCVLAVVAPATVFAPVGPAAAAPATVTGCTTIDAPGRYVLGGDVANTSGEDCVRIVASDVVFDGQGHTIEGTRAGLPAGVRVPTSADVRNVTVRDVRLRNWSTGVFVLDAAAVAVADLDVRRTTTGVEFDGVDSGTIRRVRAANGVVSGTTGVKSGIRVFEGSDVLVEDLRVEGYGTGVELAASDSRLRDARVVDNDRTGLALGGDRVRDARAVNVTARRNRDGVVLTGGTVFVGGDERARNLTVTDSRIVRNDRDGVRFSGGALDDPAVNSTLNNSTVVLSGNDGVNVTAGANGTRLRNVLVSSSGVHGVRIPGPDRVRLTNVTSRSNGAVGISVDGFNDDTVDLRLAGVTSRRNGRGGIFVMGAENLTLSAIEADHNGDDGIFLEFIEGLTIEGVSATGNDRDGVSGASLFGDVRISDGLSADNGDSGIGVESFGDALYANLTARRNGAEGIGISRGFQARNLTAVSNGGTGIDFFRCCFPSDPGVVAGATVRNNGGAEIEAFGFDGPGDPVTFRNLETALGTFDRVELRGGELLSPRSRSYEGKTAPLAALNVSARTVYIDFTYRYDDADLAGADESTLALYNATDSGALRKLSPGVGQIDRRLNLLTANVTGRFRSDPLASGGRVELVVLANRSDDAPSGPTALAPDLQPPTDPDGDGDYEDVTGDGTFDVVDVAEFLALFDGQSVSSQSQFFQFKADGTINVLDVAALLDET